MDEIIGQRRKRLVRAGFASMVEDIREYLDQWEENNKETAQEFLLALGQQLDDLFQIRTAHSESIPVDGMLKKIVDDLPLETVGRKLDICVSADPDIHLFINRMQLETICLGLIRNAVENTPDSGYIEIHVIEKADHTLISVSDTGTGITSASQKHIFKGFFHTQDSGAYASKIPFAFNAGGAGLDLLRIKTLADRHGFLLEMESDRCPHIPMDHDQCCGDRSVCSAVNHAEDCERSGGSTFSLLFPHVLFQAGENV